MLPERSTLHAWRISHLIRGSVCRYVGVARAAGGRWRSARVGALPDDSRRHDDEVVEPSLGEQLDQLCTHFRLVRRNVRDPTAKERTRVRMHAAARVDEGHGILLKLLQLRTQVDRASCDRHHVVAATEEWYLWNRLREEVGHHLVGRHEDHLDLVLETQVARVVQPALVVRRVLRGARVVDDVARGLVVGHALDGAAHLTGRRDLGRDVAREDRLLDHRVQSGEFDV